jgi:hypothetical protein
MGRSSLDATNACLIRAVRAARAACPGRTLCPAVCPLARPVRAAVPFFAAVDVVLVFLCVIAVVPLVGFAGASEVCAVTGDTAIKTASTPKSQRAQR